MQKILMMICVIVFLVASGIGCAPKKPSLDASATVLVWPSAPDEPRIAFLNAYYGGRDFYHPSIFQIFFGTPPNSFLYKPSAVYASGDRIYVALTGDASVAIIDLKAQEVRRIDDWGRGRIGLPLGLAGLPDGTLYVSDGTAKKILVFDKDEKYKFSFGANEGMRNPAGMAFNTEHTRLYVVDSKAHDVNVFSPDGKFLFKFGSDGKEPGHFFFPSTIAVSPKTGNLCVVDTQNFRVQIFDKDGKFIRTFGELGDQPGTFSRPKGVAFDSEGHLYVSDYAFSNIQIFDENGQLLLWLGSAGVLPGYFQLPAGLFMDGQDRLYVADSLNNRVEVFQYLSESWKRDHPDEYKVYVNAGSNASK